MQYIIALDVGTSSMRAVLYSSGGSIIHSCGYEYHTIFPKPSYVEQDPETWNQAALYTLKGIGEYMQAHGLKAEAISVTSQRASMIPMDVEGNPLHNAIMWQDKRTIAVCEHLEREYGLKYLHRRTGFRVNPFLVLNKILWFKENQKGLFAKTQKFIGVQDYVILKLTGCYVTDWTQASRTMLMNLETFTWDQELLGIAGINEDQLCTLVPPGSVAGSLTEEVSQNCALPAGLPVVVSGGDQQNAAIALGVVHPGMAEANTGTGSFLLSYAQKPVFDEDCRVLCQAGAIAGTWVAETAIFNTGAIYRWFKEQLCPDFRNQEFPYVLMDQEAALSPVGSNGVMLIPHFEGSAAPYWNPRAKGVFFNLGLGTTRGDMLRAILEGITLEIAENLALMRALIGEINEVSVAGGMVKSDMFCDIQASAYKARIIRFMNPEASSLGACINASVALGFYPSVEEAFRAMVTESAEFNADPGKHKIYQQLRQRKNKLYQALAEGKVYQEFMEAI